MFCLIDLPFSLIISCEHAGNSLPAEYRRFFRNHRGLLNTHRGFDIGAKELAEAFAKQCSSPLFVCAISRLLVDVNRSESNPSLIPLIRNRLNDEERHKLLKEYYFPYRIAVQKEIEKHIKNPKRIVHLSVHSFTPVLNGMKRQADVGLLYDPSRKNEKDFCLKWKIQLRKKQSGITIRQNYPYRGVSDGLVSSLRRIYSEEKYIGIELEVNQKYPIRKDAVWKAMKKYIVETFIQMN